MLCRVNVKVRFVNNAFIIIFSKRKKEKKKIKKGKERKKANKGGRDLFNSLS